MDKTKPTYYPPSQKVPSKPIPSPCRIIKEGYGEITKKQNEIFKTLPLWRKLLIEFFGFQWSRWSILRIPMEIKEQ